MKVKGVNKKIIKETSIIMIPLLLLNFVLTKLGFSWAIYPYQTIIILSFSIIFVYSKNILSRDINIYKKSRFTMILIGAISGITLISGVRDIMSGELKIIVNGVMSVEFCHLILCVFFMGLFISYAYIEVLNREIILQLDLKGDEADQAKNNDKH